MSFFVGLPKPARHGPRKTARPRRRGRAALLALALLAGCARDSEADLRAQLDQWFYLGRTAYFDSRTRCTAAMLFVTIDRPRATLAVQGHPDHAKQALRSDGIAALRVDGVSPDMLTDAMLLTGAGTFGKQAYAAGALAGPCLEDKEIRKFLYEALSRPGATLAFDSATGGLMILDPVRYTLFYIAGDVW